MDDIVNRTAAPADASPFDGADAQPFGARRFGRVNWLGLWTLYKREVRRFLKVALQTVFAPVISTLLFLVVFMFALGQGRDAIYGTPFIAFLVPGLVMMSILNNAFANSSSSILISKVQGNIIDYLMPPLSAAELTAGFVAGAATRGLMVGVVTAIAMWAVAATQVDIHVTHWWAVIYFAVSASVLLGIVGVLGGVWAEKFDQLAAVTNFVITPLAFLSGTFYSIRELYEEGRLPQIIYDVSHWNPFFYLIDGFRYGFNGVSDAPVMHGVVIIFVLNVVFLYICYALFKSGYRLKS